MRPTVFSGPYDNGVRDGPVADGGTRQHPNAVLGPLEQLVNDELLDLRVVDLDHGGVWVTPCALNVVDLVVDNVAVTLGLWRGFPDHPD